MSKGEKKKSGIVKRIAKWFGILIAAVFVLIIGASIAIYVIVDKPFIENQMSSALHRQVSIGNVGVSVFSVLSGIEVKDVAISNYKTETELKTLQGKEVPAGDRFVMLKSFTFKVAFGPLLDKKLVLKELLLSGLDANIVRDKNGRFNFSDLLEPKKMTAEEKAEAEKKKAEEAKKAAEAKKNAEPSKPLSADDIPVKVEVGKVGLENGNINFTDLSTGQKVQVYAITAKVFDIAIDPKDLNNSDIVKVHAGLGIKTIGVTSGGSVKSFDITASLDGSVIPFDKKTRLLDPEVSLKASSPKGMVTGLQIFDKMKGVSALDKYTGKFDFLKDDVTWKNADVNIWYKGNVAKLTDGKIHTDDFKSTFAATINTATLSVDAPIDFSLSSKHTAAIRGKVQKNVEKLIVGKAKSIVKADKVTDSAMKPLLGADGGIFIKYMVKGTLSSPNADMVAPKLPSLSDLVKEAAGDLADVAKDKAKDAAQKAVDKNKDKVQEKAAGKVKKLFGK
jgi:hypothetical protein